MASTHARRQKRFLVFARFYLVPDFLENLRPFEHAYEFALFSDSQSVADDIRERFYGSYATGEECAEIGPEEEAEVIARCRLLRNLPVARARRQLHAMACALAERFEAFEPDAAITHLVDDYVTHLFTLIAKRRGKRLITFSHAYFPGYALLNEGWAGAAFPCRHPDDAEVSSVLEQISPRAYRQDYKQPARYNHLFQLKQTLRYRLKRIVFAVLAHVRRDPLNYHFTVLPHIVERRRLRDLAKPTDFSTDWRAELDRLKSRRPGQPVVYFPLAYFPEATIDYWISDLSILDYENTTVAIVEALAGECIVAVKEHLHMSGARNRAFFARLKSVPGVVSVNPAELSNDVLAASDAMIIGGGSAGIEATIRGKPVLTFAPGVYWFAGSGAQALDLSDVERWPAEIRDKIAGHRPLSDAERFEFVRRCLSTNARQRPGGRLWPLVREDDLRVILEAA